MAHPCFSCQCECYCHGDIDDTIVSFTPGNCNSCGCMEEDDYETWDDFEDEDIEDEQDLECPVCMHQQFYG